ncbi:trimethylamine methyltransferase family protein [Candidatus Rariloculus sp.]|uniref:trimethylamine methyltransferase family protein n=1 Tax=Candidatus Rariloculus sp. TaxID=3101265 RepID=UPI003D151AB1
MTDNPRRRRAPGRRSRTVRSGRAVKLAARQRGIVDEFTGWIDRRIPYFEVLDTEALELIEHNADTVLEEIGIEFREFPQAIELWKEAGADVEGERVRFPRGMCRSLVRATAPREYTQHARNPRRTTIIGGDRTVLVPAYGSPFVRDLDQGRRYATIEDFRNFVKLTQMSPGLHHSGGTICEPVDVPVNKRHFDMVYSHIKYGDKPFMGSVTHPERAEDTVAMAKILFGEDFIAHKTVLTSLINANSPLTFDATMLGAATVYAENNQATVISPFLLAGAMSPVTVAGTLTQILAEALAGMAYIQLVRPGAPVVFGSFAAAVSMQSGAPTFGTPEPSLVLYGAGQLARRLGVPFRSGGGLCASKIPDAQAAYEAANTLQTAALAGVNFMLHTAGWLEGGLSMGYEKFILDVDQANMIAVLLKGVDLSENAQALDAMREVGPGSHFLGAAHTRANFETAFYRSNVADNNSFEQWEQDGSLDAAQRANRIWKQMLGEYEAPPLDPAIDEALVEFIDRRKSEFEDRNY